MKVPHAQFKRTWKCDEKRNNTKKYTKSIDLGTIFMLKVKWKRFLYIHSIIMKQLRREARAIFRSTCLCMGKRARVSPSVSWLVGRLIAQVSLSHTHCVRCGWFATDSYTLHYTLCEYVILNHLSMCLWINQTYAVPYDPKGKTRERENVWTYEMCCKPIVYLFFSQHACFDLIFFVCKLPHNILIKWSLLLAYLAHEWIIGKASTSNIHPLRYYKLWWPTKKMVFKICDRLV